MPDINNLTLADETFDPSANQYAPPTPVPPGIYLVTLDFREEDPEKRFRTIAYSDKYHNKAGTGYKVTELIGSIAEVGSEFENRRVVDDFMSSGIFNRDTSQMASLILTLGGELSGRESHDDLCTQLEQLLAGEPTVKVKTDWAWRGSKEGGYQRVRGQKNFPKDSDGNFVCAIEDEVTGEKIAGYATIARYIAS
jgi:hypothetical protein